MAENAKFTDKAAELAGQAAAAAGPMVAQARERAAELAAQAAAAAGPIAEQARIKAAQGVDVIAENLDKLTGGKYSEKIHSMASKVESALDTKPAAADPVVPPTATETTVSETVVPTTVTETIVEPVATDTPPLGTPVPDTTPTTPGDRPDSI